MKILIYYHFKSKVLPDLLKNFKLRWQNWIISKRLL